MSAQPSTSKVSPPVQDDSSEFSKRLAAGNEATPLLTSKDDQPAVPKNLNQWQKFSFGLGHVINDIIGVLWFSYALLFLQVVVDLTPTVSASLLFLGQLTDAVATPFVGILIDKFNSKKKWHFLGVVLIAIGFPFIFHYWNDTSWRAVLWYAIAIVVFQMGWTMVQIAHLSLIPDMTIFLQERAELTTLRYTIFVCSNIAIYLVAYFVLQDTRRNDFDIIEPRDGWKFEAIAVFAVLLGVFCSLIFQGVLHPPATSKPSQLAFNTKTRVWAKICRICQNPKLHLVAFVHTSSRVFHSLNLVYMPFYINETEVREAGIIAMAPFCSFIGSLAASLIITYTSKVYSNNKILFTIGTFFALLSSACVFFDPDRSQDPTFIYAASILYGIGSAMTIVKSLCIAANFIGNNTEDGAFIYGLITFSDKILNGVIIFIIEYSKCLGIIDYHHYYKFVLTFFSGFVTIAGFIFLQLLPSSICYSD